MERLQEAVRQAGGTRAVAQRSGVPERSLTRYLSGASGPSAITLYRIATAASVSLDWLAGGAESATTDGPRKSDVAEQPGGEDADTVLIPLMSVVAAAGAGIQCHEPEVIDRMPFPKKLLQQLGVRPSFAQFIRHQGDSMLPTLADGGICLIDTTRARPRDGGIYAVMVGDDVLIKRLQLGAKGLTLISDNAEKYPPETLEGDEIDRVKVIGKVFWAGGGM